VQIEFFQIIRIWTKLLNFPESPDMQKTPESLTDISNLVSDIENGNRVIQIGPTALRTLRSMVESPARTAISSISELAANHDVNPSTLSRLSKTLGFSGFSAFQKIFREHVDQNSNYYSFRASRLISDYSESGQENSTMDDIAGDELRNIEALRSMLSNQAMARAADMIIDARKVGFFGRRQFYSLAAFMAYALGLIREDVELLQPIPDTSHSLNFMGETDLLIVMGCDPYTSTTVDACKIAQQLGVPIVAITDSSFSPLAQYSERHLIVPTDGHFYSNSMAASFVLAEGLLAMVAQRMGKDAIDALEKREKMNREFGTTLN
jgi:DNA-binding MurR/RpiR family transcriptional regulator